MSDEQDGITVKGKTASYARPATGMKGIIIRSFGGETYFRVYDASAENGFKDYLICHYDYEVTIEEGAYLYEYPDGRCIFDYSPEALGYTIVKKDD